MVEKRVKQKKGTICEEDTSILLQRYSVRTVLTLLHEVAQVADVQIDWNTLVKSTATGISDAWEYQMLWRHLAYRYALVEKTDDIGDPTDDDSDLDFEIEHFPSINSESLTEATACVKVLIASGIPSESDVPNSSEVEAPLTIGIFNSQSSRVNLEDPQAACLMQGMYVTVPISIQRQPIPAPSSTEVFDVNGAAGGNSALKRKRWSKAEDMELIASVQKFGEGNWANILKGDFKWDRNASQLSQRWATIRKRRGHSTVGANATSTQISRDKIDATHRALSFALDLPLNNSKAANSNVSSNIVSSASAAEAPVQTQKQPLQSPMPTKPKLVEPLPPTAKSGMNASKNSFMKSTYSSDSIVRDTAVAAGARIVSSSDAASLLKAAQTKNVIHIKSNGASSMKSPVLGNAPMHLDAHPNNVHYISTGKTTTPGSNYVGATPNKMRDNSVKTVSPKMQHNRSTSAIYKNQPSRQISPGTRPPSKQEVKDSEESKIPESVLIPKEEVREDETRVLGDRNGNKAREENLASRYAEAELRSLSTCMENPNGSTNMEIDDNNFKATPAKQVEMKRKVNDCEMMDSPIKQGSQNETVAGNNRNQSIMKDEQPNSTSTVVGEAVQNPAS